MGYVTKKFLIEGDGRIQDVGARPKIYELANKNGVKVWPRNVRNGNIEVVVRGALEDVERFHECVKEADLQRLLPNGKRRKNDHRVGDLVDYEGDSEPDFTYFAGSTSMEQVSKGTKYLMSIDTRLESIDTRLGSMDTKLVKLDKLDRLDTLPDDLAKALVKGLRNRE
jgi:acylphosphatase